MAQNTLFGEETATESDLYKRYIIPPFSVLDAQEGHWINRKKRWLQIGIKSEIGRSTGLVYQPGLLEKYRNPDSTYAADMGTSIFDPVLCELVYNWFTAPNQIIIDPFAGGSVRGIVAGLLERQYIGFDLSQQQIDANKENAAQICKNIVPSYMCSDSRYIDTLCNTQADFIFSCLPYGNLEQYSDNPQDLSTLEYCDFIIEYFDIITKTTKLLKNKRFACFVVSNFREKNGGYNNFVSDTISAFQQSGMTFYNDIILKTVYGSAPMRCNNYLTTSRKIAKIHQNVLVFIKGDAKKATEELGEVKIINPFKQQNNAD